MTYIQLVNKVLLRLREAQVSTVAETEYSALIGEFINEAKKEIEDAYDWIQLRTTLQITTAADDFRYTLTGAGDRYKILQIINDTKEVGVYKADYKFMNTVLTANGVSTGTPTYYDINGSTGGDPDIDLYPVPDGVYVLYFNMIIPQDDLSAEDDIITISHWPVILGAYMKALGERGEEGTTSYQTAAKAYFDALARAIDLGSADSPSENVWTVG